MSSENPLIQAHHAGGFQTADEVVPFSLIQPEHFLPAMDFAIDLAKANIAKIKNNSSPADFENTITALESCSEFYELCSMIYHNLFSAEGIPAIQALAQEVSARGAAFASEVMLDPGLFARVKEVESKKATLGLSAEQAMLLDKTYRQFVRNGALLSEAQKEKLRELDQELAKLAPQFSDNVLKATNAFALWIDDKKDLEGLPEGVIEAAAMEADKRGNKGKWVFTLHQPSFLPFIKFAKNRELRKKIYIAYGSRAYQDEFDNQETIKKLVSLRHQRAVLLGYRSHADFVLQERMAETPTKVTEFLEKLLAPSKVAAENELKELREFAKGDGVSELMPWDFNYYSEKLREKKYDFNSEDLRPYFPLNQVVEGVFMNAQKLYGLEFKKKTGVPVYHPEVEVFEVRDQKSNEYIGLLYTDFFPRETKRNGAWMTLFREQGLAKGQVRRPHVSIVCNFTRPTTTKPSLLNFDEVVTLFHEFGHALHGLLSKCTYRSVAGTNVYWDFVELPSQFMENWAREKQGLDLFARHYQTSELIPNDLFEKMKKAEKFLAGYQSLRQLSFSILDMAWHEKKVDEKISVSDFESQISERTRVLPKVPEVNMSCSFSHIFAGGYSAGYYSYKWAEVLDADAFEAFKEKGLFDPGVATKFREHVLSRGGTEHPMVLYKRFRGREPDPGALLRKHGL